MDYVLGFLFGSVFMLFFFGIGCIWIYDDIKAEMVVIAAILSVIFGVILLIWG